MQGMTEFPGWLNLEYENQARVVMDGSSRWFPYKIALSPKAYARAKEVSRYRENTEPYPVAIPQEFSGEVAYTRGRSLGHLRAKQGSGHRDGWVLEELFEIELMGYLPENHTGTGKYHFVSEPKRVWVNLEKVRLAGTPDDVFVSVAKGRLQPARVVARGLDHYDYLVLYADVSSLSSESRGIPIFKVNRSWILEAGVLDATDKLMASSNFGSALASLSIGEFFPGKTQVLSRLFDMAYAHVLRLKGRNPESCGPVVTHTIP